MERFQSAGVSTDAQMNITAESAPALENERASFLADGMLIVVLFAVANFLSHVYFNNRYGYFRDEFDYMACGDHLAWGYVDQPPLIPFLIHICRALLGDSLRSIRFIPALASSLLIVQTAAIARELGGRRYALLIILPNVLWNIKYDWPFVQLIWGVRAEGRDVVLGPFPYFFQQTLLVNPLTAPIWLAGLFALLFSMRFKPYRALGWCYLVCYTVFFMLHGKNYYLAPVYPMLLASGAVVIESAIHRTANAGPHRRWLKLVIALVLLASGAHLTPVVVPVLSPDGFLAYTKYLPFKLPVMEHAHARAALPQWYSDQFGWKEIVDETAVAWNRIPAAERPGCGIFAQDYGQAGAIDFFGRRAGLPPALSGHQTYFLWGPRGYSGNCMIVLDDRREVLERLWEHVEYVGTSADNPYALEKQIDVFLCKGAKFGTLTQLWPKLKRWR